MLCDIPPCDPPASLLFKGGAVSLLNIEAVRPMLCDIPPCDPPASLLFKGIILYVITGFNMGKASGGLQQFA